MVLDDDWPDFDLLSAFSEDPAALRRWVAGSRAVCGAPGATAP